VRGEGGREKKGVRRKDDQRGRRGEGRGVQWGGRTEEREEA